MIHDGLFHGYAELLGDVGVGVWLCRRVVILLLCLRVCILFLQLALAWNMLDLRLLPRCLLRIRWIWILKVIKTFVRLRLRRMLRRNRVLVFLLLHRRCGQIHTLFVKLHRRVIVIIIFLQLLILVLEAFNTIFDKTKMVITRQYWKY
jgi:hypothetical protein